MLDERRSGSEAGQTRLALNCRRFDLSAHHRMTYDQSTGYNGHDRRGESDNVLFSAHSYLDKYNHDPF